MDSTTDLKNEDEKIRELVEQLKKLGLINLPNEVEMEKIERRILESQMLSNKIEIEEHLSEGREERLWASIVSLQSKSFDEAARYNNLIITFGYAGFFAIWGFTKDDLTVWEEKFIAVMIGTSLLIYISWTFLSTFLNSYLIREVVASLGSPAETLEERLNSLAEVERKVEHKRILMFRFYPIVFVCSSIIGLLGGALLLLTLSMSIFGIPFSLDWVLQKVGVL